MQTLETKVFVDFREPEEEEHTHTAATHGPDPSPDLDLVRSLCLNSMNPHQAGVRVRIQF